jgi:hypothetical protein
VVASEGRGEGLTPDAFHAINPSLEQKFKSKLHLSRVPIRTSDLAKIAVSDTGVWVVIVGLIENIKEVGLKPKLLALRYLR